MKLELSALVEPPQSESVDSGPLDLRMTGFVASDAGSVASANAVILRSLVERGCRIEFHTKPSFVDPREVFPNDPSAIDLVDCTNTLADGLRRRLTASRRGVWGRLWGGLDAWTYLRKLSRSLGASSGGDAEVWLGDWARRRGERPLVSFAQGPPGTDARSVFTRRELISRLSGRGTWRALATAAAWRLNYGLPPMKSSNAVIVGSAWSRRKLIDGYGLHEEGVYAIPYPINLNAFRPGPDRRPKDGPLRLFWLGRFAPRKRLDLFLDGAAGAIRQGCDVEAWVVGKSAFAPGFERLLEEFPFPDRLRHWASVPRLQVPEMLSTVDVVAQPSDEENFGSAIAEGLACGVPAIVGATNGTGDYVCDRSIRLADDQTETFAHAIAALSERKQAGDLQDPSPSREVAERWFDPERVVDRFLSIVRRTIQSDAQRHGTT